MQPVTTIRLVDGTAEVTMGRNTLTVSRRDAGRFSGLCPVELVIAALGS